MTERKSISKKLRFEVFKRDKFKCQYCGKSAPDVILNIDHIDPVANGGTNELVNLITSCFDCNQGKKARLLSDDTVVQKQRKQMELIQERREQLELMLDWKKSLAQFEDERLSMISEYWASIMFPYSLNENGTKSLEKLIKKFPIEDILESIETATKRYIQFDEKGEITKESVEEAFNKVGGICALKNMPELKQKMAYIKGICRNRFSYWDNKKGSIILNNYVDTLKNQGWGEERIVDNLVEEVIPKSKEAKNWSEWRNFLEGWKEEQEKPSSKEYSIDTLETFSNVIVGEMNDTIDALCHLGKLFPKFDAAAFKESILNESFGLISAEQSTQEYLAECNSISFFEIPEEVFENLGVCIVLEGYCNEMISGIFRSVNLAESNYSEKDKMLMKEMLKEKLKHCLTMYKRNAG